MAQIFRQRIAQAEAMARADMLRFQPEVLWYLPFGSDIIKLSFQKEISLWFCACTCWLIAACWSESKGSVSVIFCIIYSNVYINFVIWFFRVDWVSVLMEFWDHYHLMHLKKILILAASHLEALKGIADELLSIPASDQPTRNMETLSFHLFFFPFFV